MPPILPHVVLEDFATSRPSDRREALARRIKKLPRISGNELPSVIAASIHWDPPGKRDQEWYQDGAFSRFPPPVGIYMIELTENCSEAVQVKDIRVENGRSRAQQLKRAKDQARLAQAFIDRTLQTKNPACLSLRDIWKAVSEIPGRGVNDIPDIDGSIITHRPIEEYFSDILFGRDFVLEKPTPGRSYDLAYAGIRKLIEAGISP
jgi:hypothetical protein